MSLELPRFETGEAPSTEKWNAILEGCENGINATITLRGDWVATENYDVNDAVWRSGSYWIVLLSNSNSEPSAANTNWRVLGGGGLDAEAVRDIIATTYADSATLDFTTTDATDATTAEVKAGSISNVHIAANAAIDASKLAGVATTSALASHTSNTNNPHSITKAQVGLGNVDNTSDAAKPISTATQTALDGKANTSHTHTTSDITNFVESLQDAVAAFLGAGAGISMTYDDANNTFQIVNTAPLTTENVHDIVGAMTLAGTNVTATYDDAAGTLTISSFGGGGGGGLSSEDVQDVVASLLQSGTNVSLTYNDTANTLTVTATNPAHKSTHVSGGSDAFTSTDIIEAAVRRVLETNGATLAFGAIGDGQYLKRSGTTIISDTPSGSGGGSGSGSGGSGTFKTLRFDNVSSSDVFAFNAGSTSVEFTPLFSNAQLKAAIESLPQMAGRTVRVTGALQWNPSNANFNGCLSVWISGADVALTVKNLTVMAYGIDRTMNGTYNINGASFDTNVTLASLQALLRATGGGWSDVVVGGSIPAFEGVSTKTAVFGAPLGSVRGAVAPNGKIYILGDGTSAIQEYDPVTDTRTTKTATLAAAVGSVAAASAPNGKIYIFGGLGGSNLNTIQEYDPATDTRTTKTATLAAATRQMSAATAQNGKIYIFGGFSNTNLNTIQEYDPVTDTLVTKSATLAVAGNLHAVATALNGKIYIFGGIGNGGVSSNAIQEYDPVTDTLVTKSATLAAAANSLLSATAPNGKIYIFGSGNTIQEYDPATDTRITRSLSLPASPNNGAAALANNGRIYIWGDGTTAIREYDPATGVDVKFFFPLLAGGVPLPSYTGTGAMLTIETAGETNATRLSLLESEYTQAAIDSILVGVDGNPLAWNGQVLSF